MIQLVFLYGHPPDRDAFESFYANEHLPLARAVPGCTGVETALVLGTVDGSPAPYHRITIATFDDQEAFEAASASPEAERALADAGNDVAGPVTMLVAQVSK